MSIEVADLVASLGVDASRFNAGMAAAETRAKTGAASMRLAFGAIGIGAAVALGEMVKKAADFQSVTQTLANNTNMGAAGLEQMRAGVLQLAQQTGQPLESLSQGWMHIANHAYDGAAAMNIAAAAAKNAAATGGDAGNDMNVLAGIMREYGVSAAQAGRDTGLATRYMDVLHNAVANSNFTMNDFVEGGKRAFAQAGAFGVPISQISAQLAVLSEHGFPNSRIAGLNWAGMLRSLESPTKAAMKGMQSLSALTGVNLVADIKKLQQNGAFLPQFLVDIQKATGGDFNKVRALMPQSSYATALEGLLRNLKEVQRVQGLTDAAQAGRTAPGMVGTNEAFAAWSKTTNAQMDILRGTFQSISVEIGSVFLPALNRVLGGAVPWVQVLATWVGHHQRLAAGILAGVAALGTLAGGMAVVSALSAPLAALLGAISLPLVAVAAASAGLAVAWANDWGGIREKVASAWATIQPIVRGLQTELRTLGELFKIGGFGLVWTVLQSQLRDLATAFGAWVPGAAAGLTSRLGALAGQIGGWIRTVGAPALVTHLQTWADAFWGWVRQAVPPLMREAGILGSRLWGWITGTAAPAIGNRLQAWGAAFWSWVQPAGAALVARLPGILDRVGAWVASAAATLVTKFGPWVGAAWHWVRQVGPPLTRELARLITLAAAGLIALTPRFVSAFATFTTSVGTWMLTTGLPEIAGFGLDMGEALVQGVLDAIGQLGPLITAALGKLVQQAIQSIPGAGGALNMLAPAGGALGQVGNVLANLAPGWRILPGGASGLSGLAMPPIAGPPPSARGGAGSARPPAIVNVHVHPGGITATGGTARDRAAGHEIGKAVDDALRRLAGHGAGGTRLLPGEA